MQHAATWCGIAPQSCTDDNGNMVGSTGSTGELITKYVGKRQRGRSRHRLLQVGSRPSSFKFLKLGSGDGSGPAIIQAATAFKSEPYK